MREFISAIGYGLINTWFGQLLFRKNRLGRFLVRTAFSLERLLPLSTPQTVMIDICNLCNFKCVFCPTSDRKLLKQVGRPSGMMSLDEFKKIVDGLTCFPGRIPVLCLHKDGEPLLNKNVVEMVRYAKDKDISGNIEITTNGSRLTRSVAIGLIEAGLDSIRISIEHVSDDGYKKVTQNYSKFSVVVENVKVLFEEKKRRRSKMKVLVKIIDAGLSKEEKKLFYKIFSPISDVCRVEGIMGWSDSSMKDFTLGLKPAVGMDGVTPLKEKRIVCPEPFKMMAINFDGTVSPCCDDWTWGLKMGNALTASPVDIWNGKDMNKLRMAHLNGCKDQFKACANCQYMQGVTDVFDLDNQRESLKKHYENI